MRNSQIFIADDLLLNYLPIAKIHAPKPERMSMSQYFNYLAIQLLEEMQNDCPTQEIIDFVESAIKRFSRRKSKKIISIKMVTEVKISKAA